MPSKILFTTLQRSINALNADISVLNQTESIFNLLEDARFKSCKMVFSTSLGLEDQAITHLIKKKSTNILIFTLDTGRLFPETLDLLDKTQSHYNINIKTYMPDARVVVNYINTNGINGFYKSKELRHKCCHIRKVAPLQRAIKDADIWITGIRKGQSANRSHNNFVEWDAQNKIIKINPLLTWTREDTITYIEDNNIPINPLHKKGFLSIGCAPCTRAIKKGEQERAGRWWWESSGKECGLHQIKI